MYHTSCASHPRMKADRAEIPEINAYNPRQEISFVGLESFQVFVNFARKILGIQFPKAKYKSALGYIFMPFKWTENNLTEHDSINNFSSDLEPNGNLVGSITEGNKKIISYSF